MVIVVTSGEEGNGSVIKRAVKKTKAVVILIGKRAIGVLVGPNIVELGGDGGGGGGKQRRGGSGEESRESEFGGLRKERVGAKGFGGGEEG